MAREPMTLDKIKASSPKMDWAKVSATTEEDIYQHQVEDNEDSDAALRALAG